MDSGDDTDNRKQKKKNSSKEKRMDILKQEEIDELLNAISTSNEKMWNDISESTMNSKKIGIYKFKRPDTLSKDNIRSIQRIFKTFVKQISLSISNKLKLNCGVYVTSVDQLTYEEFIRAIPNPSTLVKINADPLQGAFLLEIDPEITFSIIDRVHGGMGEIYKINRDLTDIEISVMEDFSTKLLGYLREAFSNIIDLRLRLIGVENDPTFIQIVPPSSQIVLISMEIMVGDTEGMMNFCIPYSVIAPLLSKLTSNYIFLNKDTEGDKISKININEVITRCTIEKNCDTYISLKDFKSLQKGNTILFNNSTPLSYYLCNNGQQIAPLTYIDKNKYIYHKE